MICRRTRLRPRTDCQITVSSPQDRPHAGSHVHGYEERAPAFVLTHVHAFVRAAARHGQWVATDHHVPERHGRCTPRQRHEAREHPRERRAMSLHHAAHDRDAATPERQARDGQAEKAWRRRPDVAMNTEHRGRWYIVVTRGRKAATLVTSHERGTNCRVHRRRIEGQPWSGRPRHHHCHAGWARGRTWRRRRHDDQQQDGTHRCNSRAHVARGHHRPGFDLHRLDLRHSGHP